MSSIRHNERGLSSAASSRSRCRWPRRSTCAAARSSVPCVARCGVWKTCRWLPSHSEPDHALPSGGGSKRGAPKALVRPGGPGRASSWGCLALAGMFSVSRWALPTVVLVLTPSMVSGRPRSRPCSVGPALSGQALPVLSYAGPACWSERSAQRSASPGGREFSGMANDTDDPAMDRRPNP